MALREPEDEFEFPEEEAEEYDEPLDMPEEGESEEESESDRYWAAREGRYIACEIAERVRDYYDRLETAGMIDLWSSTHQTFYGLGGDGRHETSEIIEFGEDGEKLGVRSNQLRSLVKFVYLSATADTPTIKPRAINSDPRSLAQIPTARRILEYYDRVKDGEKYLNGAALRALIYAKGYVWQSWDPSIGPLGEDGKPQGDLLCRACSPLDVACDLDNDGEHDWFAVRVRKNRWDEVAIYADPKKSSDQSPGMLAKIRDLKAKILHCSNDILDGDLTRKLWFGLHPKKDQGDSVFEYHFMHRRTPALPEGRYVIMLPDETVLFEGPLPYETLPIDEMAPEEFIEMGAVAYSSAWDLLGMQQAYDAVMSVCITNLDAFGVNDILIPEGVEIALEEVRDGVNAIRYPAGDNNRPSMLEKFSIKDEAFKLKDWLKGDMELALGVNSVARGEPEKSLESGAALALVQAQAIQAQSPFVKAYNKLIAAVNTNRIKILKRHLQPERTIAIAGSDDPDSVQAFSVQDIDSIDRIEVESVNPLFKTIAGKQNAADKLLERDMIPSAAAYMHFQETGRLETVTDDARRQDLFGKRVREILMKGPEVAQKPGDPMDPMAQPRQVVPECPYVFTDHPKICIDAARSVMDSFENRKNEAIIMACTAYISDVLYVWRHADTAALQLMGYPLPPPPPGALGPDGKPLQQGAQPGSGTPNEPPKPTPAGKPAPEKAQDQKAPPEGSAMPSLPKAAENPMQGAA